MLLVVLAALCISSNAEGLRLPLQGNYSAMFFWFTTLHVNGVPFTVTVDTGSSDLLVPAVGCKGCFGGQPSQYFPVAKGNEIGCGTTLKCNCAAPGGPCDFSVTYGGALTESAIAVHAQVSLGAGWNGTVQFGATYNVTQGNGLVTSYQRKRRRGVARQNPASFPEGLWGLAWSQLNSLGTSTLFDTLASANGNSEVFALCVQEVGGLLVLGEVPQWGSWVW